MNKLNQPCNIDMLWF